MDLKINTEGKTSPDSSMLEPSQSSPNASMVSDHSEKVYLESLSKLKQRGRIELIMGPMFAGKSTELLRRVRRLEISGKKCLSIKYKADTRYSEDSISTHDKQLRTAVAAKQLSEIQNWQEFDVIGIDEGQFFEDLVDFCETAANQQKIVILSALSGTWEKKGWTNILELIPLCEKVKSLSAICQVCSANAHYTFRKCAGNSQELIGGSESYMPLCRECYQEKSKPKKINTTPLQTKILYSETQSTAFNSGENSNELKNGQMIQKVHSAETKNLGSDDKVNEVCQFKTEMVDSLRGKE